jgi:hypothetical protein
VSFRVLLLFATLSFAVAATSAWAQQANKMPVVGVLSVVAGPDDPTVEALRQGLRELGYVVGRDFRIETRTAQGDADRLPRLAEELLTAV